MGSGGEPAAAMDGAHGVHALRAWSRQTSADGAAALASASQGVFADSPLGETVTYALATERGYPGAELRNAQSGKVLGTYLGARSRRAATCSTRATRRRSWNGTPRGVSGSPVFTIDSHPSAAHGARQAM